MAVSRIKEWVSGEVLNASDLNAELDNLNQTASAFPLTENVSAAGYAITNAVLGTLKQLNENVYCIDNYADLAAAISGIGSATSTLLINKNVNVTANATVPSTLTLWFVGAGKLTVSVACTATISGPIRAEPRQIFDGSGTVAFTSNYSLSQVCPQWWGTVADGSTDANASLTLFDTASPKDAFLPNGEYELGTSDWQPAAQDINIRAAGGVSFGTNQADYTLLVPFQAAPVWSQNLTRKSYGAAWSGYGNVFQLASYAKSDIATTPVVAVFGGAEGTVADSKCWGGNFVAYARNATATSIGIELNCGADAVGATAYGLVIASANTQPVTNALQIQSNQSASQFVDGIKFNWRATEGCVTGSMIGTTGASGATCEKFLSISGVAATTAEVDLPSFSVAASVSSPTGRVQVTASASGLPRVGVSGSATNIGLLLRPKGTGNCAMQDGSGNDKVLANTTGVGFQGTSPIAKPTVTGAHGSNAALQSLLTALANYGLITDSSS